MCYAKPGPRCSTDTLNDIQAKKEEISIAHKESGLTASEFKKTSIYHDLIIKLEEFEKDYQETPGYLESLQSEIVTLKAEFDNSDELLMGSELAEKLALLEDKYNVCKSRYDHRVEAFDRINGTVNLKDPSKYWKDEKFEALHHQGESLLKEQDELLQKLREEGLPQTKVQQLNRSIAIRAKKIEENNNKIQHAQLTRDRIRQGFIPGCYLPSENDDQSENIKNHIALTESHKMKFDSMSVEEKMKLPTETFMSYMRLYTPQSYGGQIEARILSRKGWTKVPASVERGDALTKEGEYLEIKASMLQGGRSPKANFVQIRPHHNLDSYRCYVIDLQGKVHTFSLNKEQMANELVLTKASLAHGSKLTNNNANKEYAIRFPWKPGNEVYDRWVSSYKVEDNSI